MKRSTARILTTHAGSLPRPREILDLVEGRDQREVYARPGAAQLIDWRMIAFDRSTGGRTCVGLRFDTRGGLAC